MLIRRRFFYSRIAVAGVVLLGASVAPARADFVSDFLNIFKPPAQQQAAPTLAPVRRQARPKIKVASRQPAVAHDARTAPKPSVALLQVLKERGAREVFLVDPTLRSGDLVVTETGISLFSGGHGGKHSLADFRPVATSSLRNRTSLIELERVSGLLANRSATANAAPVEMPLTVSLSRKSRETAESNAATLVARCVSADASCADMQSLSVKGQAGAAEKP